MRIQVTADRLEVPSRRGPATAGAPPALLRTPSAILNLHGMAGNAAVAASMAPSLQRDEDPDAAPPSTDAAPIGPIDKKVELSTPEPITVPARELGDFPEPDPNAPTVQADDDTAHPSADIAVQYPFSYQGTLIYRNLNIAQIRSLHLDIGHEPSVAMVISPDSGLAVQQAITLINWHWMPPWHREVEVGLSAVLQQTLMNQPNASGGGQVQIEQHIVPWFSITLSASGMFSPAQRGRDGRFDLGPAAGAVIHFP